MKFLFELVDFNVFIMSMYDFELSLSIMWNVVMVFVVWEDDLLCLLLCFLYFFFVEFKVLIVVLMEILKDWDVSESEIFVIDGFLIDCMGF